MKPLDGGIARQVYKAAKKAKLVKSATLIRVTQGTRTPGAISAGTNPTATSYPCGGFVDDFKAYQINNTLVFVGDRLVSIFGASLAAGVTPVPDDKVTIAGSTYRIRLVTSDPANGMYVCQTHGPALP